MEETLGITCAEAKKLSLELEKDSTILTEKIRNAAKQGKSGVYIEVSMFEKLKERIEASGFTWGIHDQTLVWVYWG